MRRQLLLLTSGETNVARTALAYVVENAGSADYDGDHDRSDAKRHERVLEVVSRQQLTPGRDLDRDLAAITTVLQAAISSACSCAGSPPPHAKDCWVTTARKDIDRVYDLCTALRALSSNAKGPR